MKRISSGSGMEQRLCPHERGSAIQLKNPEILSILPNRKIMNKANPRLHSRLLLVTALAVFAWSAACLWGAEATPSPEAAKKRLENARNEIANVRSNIFLTLVKLDRVRGERDPEHPMYNAFTNQLDRMQELAQALGKHAEEMKKRGNAYFLDWEARTAAIQNPEARQRAQQRYEERKALYDGIRSFMQDAKTNFASFMSNMTQIQATFEAGRTQENIAQAKALFMNANWRSIDVQRDLMEVEDRLDQLAASFAKDEGAAESR
jgi:hypothetical protein